MSFINQNHHQHPQQQSDGYRQSPENMSSESSFDLETKQPAKLEHDYGSPSDNIPQHDETGFLRNRQPSGAIESDISSKQHSAHSSSHEDIRATRVGAIPDTGRDVGDQNGGSPPDGWPNDPGLRPNGRRALIRHRVLFGLLHYIKVVVLSIIVILLLVAVGIPVSDNGVPQAGDYSKLEFNWKTDPRSYLAPMNSSFTDYNILLDAHLHTTYSDGVLSPQQVLEFAMANGYNAIIVTDHQTVEGSLAAREYAERHYPDKITVITGMEYTSCRIHMNLIGINETVSVGPPSPSDDDLRTAINKVHSLGGLVIVNHIPWSNTTLLPWDEPRLPDNPSREKLLELGVDGFEVVNQNTFDLRTYQFVQDHSDRLVGVTGSDMHVPGSSYAWTTVNATDRSAEAIMDELRNRRTSFLLDPSGTRPIQNPPYSSGYLKYAPWGLIGDYFYGYADRYRGQYSFQASFCQNEVVDIHNRMIGWFFLWLLVAIAVLEILYWFFRWLALLLVHWVRRRFFKSH